MIAQNPLVSVIIPTHNGELYIAQAIESVLRQTYPNCEIIVINDGSTDHTSSAIQPYLKQISYIDQENQGVSIARNRGIERAKGEFIAFLDHDDFFLETKIADQVACFESQPSLGIVHSGWYIVNENGEVIAESTPWHEAPDLNLETWLLFNPTLPSAMMFRRSWVNHIGGFDQRFSVSGDTDLTFRLLLKGCQAAWLEQVNVCYRHHPSNTSKNILKHTKDSCAVRKDFFARSDLPDHIRQLEKPVRFKHLVRMARRLYVAGYFNEMAEFLQESFRFTTYTLQETISNWITVFAEHDRIRDFQQTQSYLEGLSEWRELIDRLQNMSCPIEIDIQSRSYSIVQPNLSNLTEVTPNLGFITCIEKGVLEAQSLLLFESIRRYTGSFRKCPIYAISPRSGHTVSAETKKCLDRLEVEYIDLPLLSGFDHYPQTNMVFAASYIEAKQQHEILVVLDSDTFFLREPSLFWLPDHIDVGVRPVDTKGICTSGEADTFDRYWHLLCQACDVDYDRIPWIETFVDRVRIKSCYNGGLSVVRANKGIFNQWRENFTNSISQGLEPRSEGISITTATGVIEPKGGRIFGVKQTTLAMAIWGLTDRVQIFPSSYNYPLHTYAEIDPELRISKAQDLIHIHYHWMFNSEYLDINPLLQSDFELDQRTRNWLMAKMPLNRIDRLQKVRLNLDRSIDRLQKIKLDLKL